MTQAHIPAQADSKKKFAKFDFSTGLNLIPVIVERAGHLTHSVGVMLRYEEPQPVLEAQFKAAVASGDDFPREIGRASDKGFYTYAEEHDLTSLQDLIQRGHPQTQELASAYQDLARVIHGRLAKAELTLA